MEATADMGPTDVSPTAVAHAFHAAASDAPAEPPRWLRRGVEVIDGATGRKGVVQDVAVVAPTHRPPKRAWLRPVRGGCEWTPKIADLSPCPDNGGGAAA
ncbi:hypothetical protein J7E88_12790 [Streptomyces sp. ISL-10]|uniref:hypothetical protein n=1 Tax=Streptomyces sp. ISL-10 TaxID=2819172 RepID=UPI001BEB4289|nr:hypothetical protein [Streptomyces sp. ISL-10]MBT2366160.1 hypothetical protein [Streptomyces sp. ISL-10]